MPQQQSHVKLLICFNQQVGKKQMDDLAARCSSAPNAENGSEAGGVRKWGTITALLTKKIHRCMLFSQHLNTVCICMFVFEIQREKERIFHLLIGFPKGHNSYFRAKLKAEPETTSASYPTWMSEAQVHGSPSTAFTGALAGRWAGSRSASTPRQDAGVRSDYLIHCPTL